MGEERESKDWLSVDRVPARGGCGGDAVVCCARDGGACLLFVCASEQCKLLIAWAHQEIGNHACHRTIMHAIYLFNHFSIRLLC